MSGFSLLMPLAGALQMPPVAPIDVTGLVAVMMGLMVVLIPITGFTARFALKPVTEAIARMREGQGAAQERALIEKRLALLESQMSNIESDMTRIADMAEFDRQLQSGD